MVGHGGKDRKEGLTCLSHSFAKGIVSYVDDFGLNCSQEEIIAFLENTVQRHQKKSGGHGDDFCHSSVFFKVIIVLHNAYLILTVKLESIFVCKADSISTLVSPSVRLSVRNCQIHGNKI